MNTHRWITDPMPGDVFDAYCLACGLMILDPQPFDNSLYPLLCDPDSTGCTHRIVAVPFGAECHDCGEHYENNHTADAL